MKYSGHIRLINDKVKQYNIDIASNILVIVGEHLSGKTLLLNSINDKDTNKSVQCIRSSQISYNTIEYYVRKEESCKFLNRLLKHFFPNQKLILSYKGGSSSYFSRAEINGVPINIINSGVIKLIFILIEIIYQNRKCLLIDDIETNLSIDVQKKLSLFIKEYYEGDMYQDIIITTHSPFMFDRLLPYTTDISMLLD